MRPVLLFRTHRWDPFVDAALREWRDHAGMEVVAVVDGPAFPAVARRHRALRFDRDALRALGLAIPAEAAWLCGDYNFLLARLAMPAATHFWMVEHDVLVHRADPGSLLRLVDRAPEVDLAAPAFHARDERWDNTAAMRAFTPHVYGVFFPLLRVSARAVDVLLEARREVSAAFLARRVAALPNDEALTATALVAAGLECRDLNGFGEELYRTDELFFGPPLSRRAIQATPPDGRVRHPALAGPTLLEKAIEALRWTDNPAVVERMAAHEEAVRLELGDHAARALAASAAAARARLRV